MPVLAALDECLTILARISNHANAGLTDPTKEHGALVHIQRCCNEIDETIQGILQAIEDDEESTPGSDFN